MLLTETALTIMAVLIALVRPEFGQTVFLPLEKGFVRLARRRRLSVLLVGAAALAVRVALLPILPVPKPAIQDEFSYLLAGDTFAHWRLTNPPHPMWIHFETFHVIQQPTYTSMYYPAQGMFLAAGQLLLRHPFWGVWLSSGLMCAAICWMLQVWTGPVWALFGGLLAVIRIAAFSYWDNSYWGGSVAALGGALVLGALPRIMHRDSSRDAAIMGLGFGVLANSRPYETVFFGLPIIAWYVAWILRNRTTATLRRAALPFTIVILCVVLFMGYYNWRTTGNPVRSPYFVNLATYNSVPYFPWQQPRSRLEYHHAVMMRFYLEWWLLQYRFARFHAGMFAMLKGYMFWAFFLGPALTLPFVIAVLQTPYNISFANLCFRTRFLLCLCAFVFLGAMLPAYFNPHYVAAVTCVIYALLITCLRQVRDWSPRGSPSGSAIVRLVPVVVVALFVLRTINPLLIRNPYAPATWCSLEVQNFDRARMISELSNQPGDHLILVRYSPGHTLSNEWVYNGADIDHSKVVWARDMGEEHNAELLHYFDRRHIWLVEPDLDPVALQPYSEHH